jgi:hypothetical protein
MYIVAPLNLSEMLDMRGKGLFRKEKTRRLAGFFSLDAQVKARSG